MERWKIVPDFPNYEVSDHGRVRRATDSRRMKKGGTRKPSSNEYSYLWITIRDEKGATFRFFIHRLVLIAFVGSCPDGYQCNHKDGDKTNNHLSNLEWVTPSQNINHAYKHGLRSDSKGEKNAHSKLKEGEVWLIKKLLKSSILYQREIAKMFKVDPSTVSRINIGETWI